MCYEIEIVATFLIIFEAQMTILFIIQVKEFLLVKRPYRAFNYGMNDYLQL